MSRNILSVVQPQGAPYRPDMPAMAGHIPVEQLRKLVCDLPAMPRAVHDALAALRDDDVRIDECADRVARDQALAAQTLRLANSAFYGVPGRVATIQDAVQILGLRTLASLLQTVALVSRLPPPTCRPFHTGEFWRNSIGAGLFAQATATRVGLDGNIAYTAGLLHDIGSLALATHFPDAFAQALMVARTEKLPVMQAEQLVMGTDHAAVGALITTHWQYPLSIVEAIAQHHEAPARRDRGAVRLAEVVHLADLVAHSITSEGVSVDDHPAPAGWSALELGEEQYRRAVQQTLAGLEALCAPLGL